MPAPGTPPQRLLLARQLIREKGLSRSDLTLLEDILREGAGDLDPLLGSAPQEAASVEESTAQASLRRNLGLFLAFLHQFSARRLGESRAAMALVMQHGLGRLGDQAEAAHRELMVELQQPEWVGQLLDLLASLRAMAPTPAEDAGALRTLWAAFLADHRDSFRQILAAIQASEGGSEAVARLNAQMKSLNRAIQGQGRLEEALARLAEQLESCIPKEIHARVEPLILLEHVISNLRLSLLRPLDRGIHWPAVEQVRGSLRWLWDNLGWTLPRMDAELLRDRMPTELRRLLGQIRQEDRAAFSVVARALASHISLLGLLESIEPAAGGNLRDRYAAVPTFFVVESELGRMSERAYDPERAALLDPDRPEAPRLRAYLRQAVLSLQQDQGTLRSLLQQALAGQDADQLAQTLDSLKALLVNHQKQLMGELVGIFSPDVQHRLFPESPSMMEEGERLRLRIQRLWEQVPPLHGQLLLHLELQDWPRLALGLSQTYRHLLAFRRSPEFPLMRRPDREEGERLIQDLGRLLESPEDVPQALRDGMDLLGELMRFLELFLLRINARVPLIRQDLEVAQEALRLVASLKQGPTGPERTRLSHKLIQTAKRLGVRDSQALTLLKRWVRAERSQREGSLPALEQLAAHLRQLALRLEAALG
ncbi:hypothetical protein [Geothrix sp.]|jgi:hypothetical protein|uniref:hypothetical protein n=1 Tax=Geothrix sp. TaxID=1962974 RepID=UPI0025BA93B4|nr:hypothetical protein [Geothrix sp.]